MRPFRMASDHDLLPRRQAGIGLAQEAVRLGLQTLDLFGDVEPAFGRKVAELLDLASSSAIGRSKSKK